MAIVLESLAKIVFMFLLIMGMVPALIWGLMYGPVLLDHTRAGGRDLRTIAAIQTRFTEAQLELERDYWKQRQTESRYRLLFQVATDAVLVVEAASLTILEANRAAAELFGHVPAQMAGLPAAIGIDPASRPAVEELLCATRASGKPAEIRARLGGSAPGDGAALVDVSATPFRATSDGTSQLLLLVRLRSTERRSSDAARRLADFVEQTPDAVVITDSNGRLQIANPAFLALCPPGVQESQLKGQTLADLLGDPGHRLAALVADVRRKAIPAQRFGTPEEFGEFCAFMCSQQAAYLTGQNLLLDGGAYPGTF